MSSMDGPPDPASSLIQAYQGRERLVAGPRSGPLGLDAAYAAQAQVWRALVGNERPTAWKVAAPSLDAVPLAAPVFPQRLATTPARFAREDFFTLGVEAEVAFRFGRDLPVRAEPYTRAEILEAIGSAHVAMELVDTRLADPEAAGPLWRLADNLLNGGLVRGDGIPDWRTRDLSQLTVRVLGNGEPLAQTLGRPPLDDLFHCLPWWLNHVGGARAGDMVTTGA
jgi:2-keto-4-pentenoate hydratase